MNLTKMAQDEDFVLIYCMTPGGKKIFGFASSTLLDVMSASEIWYGDGMYSAVNPLIISQIYTILVKTKDQDLVIPIAFFLLRDKKKKTYGLMLESLRDRIPGDGPKIFHIDFEVGVVSATKDIFPGTKISYCHFHWLQAIKQNVAAHALQAAQNQDVTVQLYIRSFWSLESKEILMELFRKVVKKVS